MEGVHPWLRLGKVVSTVCIELLYTARMWETGAIR